MSIFRAKLFFLLLALLLPFTILAFVLFPKAKRSARRLSAKLLIWLFGIKIKAIGAQDTDAQMLIINHKSFLDVIVLESFYPKDLCWIAKKELGDIPFYGLALKLSKMLLIDRENKKELVRLLKESGEMIESGRVLAIFPEGTRNKHDRFLHFKAGAKIIAQKHHLKIQPVVLAGTRSVFDGKKLNPNITALAIFLESFTPQDGTNWYDEIREKMQKVYDEHSNHPCNR